MFKDIYLEIAKLIQDNIPEIKWIDLWANQTDYFDQELPFQLPAIFIEMSTNSINSVGLKLQDIELLLTFHIAAETLADSYIGSTNQSSALKILDFLVAVHKLLQATPGESFSRLNRTEIRQEINGGNVLQFAVSYTTMIRDYSSEIIYNSYHN